MMRRLALQFLPAVFLIFGCTTAGGNVEEPTGPPPVRPDHPAVFKATLVNHGSDELVAGLTVTLYDAEHTAVGELIPKDVTIPAGQTVDTTIVGTLSGPPGTEYTALARMAVQEAVQGTDVSICRVAYEIYLPLVLSR